MSSTRTPSGTGPGHFVLREQILELRPERRQQGVRLGAEVAADEQRLAQLAQVAAGGVGNGVLVALRQVPPQEVYRGQPEIGDEEVRGHKAEHDAPLQVAALVAVRRPAVRVHRVDVERQERRKHRNVEVQITQIQNASRNGFETRTRANGAQPISGLVAREFGKRGAADQVEEPAAERGENERDDLVVRLRAGEKANAEIGRAEQRRRQITGENGPQSRSPSTATVIGKGSVSANANTKRAQQARNLPSTNSALLAGTVTTSSSVPARRSSLHMRMVSADARKMSNTGSHSNIGRTSAMLRAKNASPQKNTNSVTPRNAAKNR